MGFDCSVKKVWFHPLSKQRLPSVQCLSWRDHVRLTGCLNLMPDFCPWWPLCKLSPWCCWWYFSLWFTLLKAFANLWPWQCHRSAVHIPCWMSVCHKIPVLVFAKFTLLNPLNQSLVVWIEHFFPTSHYYKLQVNGIIHVCIWIRHFTSKLFYISVSNLVVVDCVDLISVTFIDGWSCHKYHFCCDKHNKSFVMTSILLLQQKTCFVTTNICCDKHTFFGNKTHLFLRQTHVFVVTKIIPVAPPASARHWSAIYIHVY